MITKIILDYLDDENVSIEKKREFIKNCNFNMSDIFSLMDRYRLKNDSVYRMLNAFVYYNDDKLNNKIKKQNKEQKKARTYKKMKKVRRRKSYD